MATQKPVHLLPKRFTNGVMNIEPIIAHKYPTTLNIVDSVFVKPNLSVIGVRVKEEYTKPKPILMPPIIRIKPQT